MVNLRMFAIASALLLVPSAWALVTVPGGQVLEYYGEAAAYIEDVAIATFPAPVTGRTGEFREEQLVEGHTTFLTLDIAVERERKNASIDIEGYVRCEHRARVNFTYLGAVPFPTYVDYAGSECRVGEQVVIVPDPFLDWSASYVSPLQPTGRLLEFTAPNGERAYMEELTFHTLDHDDGWAEPLRRDYYAWTTPIFPPWVSDDGRLRSFYAPLPEDRLLEMGVEDFQVVFEKDVR